MSKNRKKWNPDNLLTYFVRITAAPGLLWFRPRRLYENERAKQKIKGGALLIANHISFMDPVYAMMIVWYRVHHFISIKELLVNRFMKFFLIHVCQCIMIDRGNFDYDTLEEITGHLKNGELVSMYPEGHLNRSEDKQVQTFKTGVVLMAKMADVPIIPMYIKERKTKFSRVEAVIGEPVYVNQIFGKRPNRKEMDQIAEMLRQKEMELERMLEK